MIENASVVWCVHTKSSKRIQIISKLKFVLTSGNEYLVYTSINSKLHPFHIQHDYSLIIESMKLSIQAYEALFSSMFWLFSDNHISYAIEAFQNNFKKGIEEKKKTTAKTKVLMNVAFAHLFSLIGSSSSRWPTECKQFVYLCWYLNKFLFTDSDHIDDDEQDILNLFFLLAVAKQQQLIRFFILRDTNWK